jgi:5-methylcytosine-specific restriction endonuclease McrA
MTTQAKRIRSPHQPTGCWIRPARRAAIYHRDNWSCVYCGRRVTDSAEVPVVLTLDHLLPKSLGGTNDASNLVSACRQCNCSRQDRAWTEFAPGGAQRRIRRLIAKPLDLAVGRAFVESMEMAA